MMKHLLTMTAALLLAVSAQARIIEAGEGQTWWGYFNEGDFSTRESIIGTGSAMALMAGIYIPENHQSLKGATIKAVRVYVKGTVFSLMGIPERAEEGEYKYGKGKVFVLRHDPKEYVLQKGGDKKFVEVVEKAYGKLELKNSFYLERGPYTLVAVLDEGVVNNNPYTIKGDFIDLFSPELTYYSETSILPGQQGVGQLHT